MANDAKNTYKKHPSITLHPATQIMLWVVCAVSIQFLHPLTLVLLLLIFLTIAYCIHAQRLFSLMQRTRWIMFSILLIYLFATPGEELWSGPYAPTYEGGVEGVLQLGRLLSVLAGLSILLSILSREQLMSGIYCLASPLKYIGVPRERVVVRLALTLLYAETAMSITAADWRTAISEAIFREELPAKYIQLPIQNFYFMDGACLLIGVLVLFWSFA